MARNIEQSGASIYPQPKRFSRFFREALKTPVGPEVTAGVIRGIVESDTWQLRHLSGPDAAPIVGWRAGMTDEQWVDLSALDDESWYATVERDFGMNLR